MADCLLLKNSNKIHNREIENVFQRSYYISDYPKFFFCVGARVSIVSATMEIAYISHSLIQSFYIFLCLSAKSLYRYIAKNWFLESVTVCH